MKIKVCHFVNIITGKSDGVYSHLKMIFKYTDLSKYEYYLLFHGNADISRELSKMGIKVSEIKTINNKFSLKMFIDYFLFIRKNKIDIVHSHLIKPYIIAGLVNLVLRKKLIFNYHGIFIDNEYYNSFDKYLYRTAHRLVCFFKAVDLALVPSFKSKQLLMRETKLFPRIDVYYDGYDSESEGNIEQFLVQKILQIKKSHFLIGVVGRMEPEKRIDLDIDILAAINKNRDDVYFLFMGDGSLEELMKDKLKLKRFESKGEILGFVRNARAYMKYFDILLNSSDREGFPLSLWEAMAQGIPVVATDVGGVKEILEKEDCGLIFPKGDIQQGAKQINLLLDDGIRRKQMGLNAVKAITDKYNGYNFGSLLNNIYDNLLKK